MSIKIIVLYTVYLLVLDSNTVVYIVSDPTTIYILA